MMQNLNIETENWKKAFAAYEYNKQVLNAFKQ